MPEELFGIETIKDLMKVGFKFGKEAADDFADKKLSLWEGIGLVDNVFELIGIGKKWSDIEKELGDLSDDEQEQLEAFAQEQFDIPNADVKEFIKDAVMWGFVTVSLVNRFKHLKDPVEPTE